MWLFGSYTVFSTRNLLVNKILGTIGIMISRVISILNRRFINLKIFAKYLSYSDLFWNFVLKWPWISLVRSFLSRKLKIGLREKFFQGQKWFFRNSDNKRRCKNRIENKIEKICSRFSYTVFHKIHFTVNCPHKDHSPVLELI